MQYSLNSYKRVYGEDGPAPAADGYPDWFTDGPGRGMAHGLPAAAPGEALDGLGVLEAHWADSSPETLPDDPPDEFGLGPAHDLADDLPDDWSDYFQDEPGDAARGDFQSDWRARAVKEEAPPSGAEPYDDDEGLVDFELAVPVHGLTLRQAVAAVARAVREKRAEFEAWGFQSYGGLPGVRKDKAFRWRFLGYKNGLMRYKAQKSIKN